MRDEHWILYTLTLARISTKAFVPKKVFLQKLFVCHNIYVQILYFRCVKDCLEYEAQTVVVIEGCGY